MHIKRIFLVVLPFSTIVILLYLYKTKSVIKSPTQPTPTFHLSSTNPGSVANVFGWGYNRSICQLPSSSTYVTFFYAQDQFIHYVYSTTPGNVKKLPTHVEPNPDHDVLCEDNKVTVFYSNGAQNKMFEIEGILGENDIAFSPEEKIGEKEGSFNMVAPSAYRVGNTLFVSFMEYGQGGENSKVYVTQKDNEKWSTPVMVAQAPSKISQVFGNSMTEYNAKPFLIMSSETNPSLFSQFNNGMWSTPLTQPFKFVGQLEWQPLATDDGLNVVFRGSDGYNYFFLDSNDGKIYETHLNEDSKHIDLNATMFKDKSGNIFSLSLNGAIRQLYGKKGISMPQYLFSKDHQQLYWVRVPQQLYSNILPIVWLYGQYPNLNIAYETADLSKLKPFEPDTFVKTDTYDINLSSP